MFVALLLLWAQAEELRPIETMLFWIEKIPEELEELSKILRQRTVLIYAELLQKGRSHEHNRIRVQAPRVRFV